MTESLWMYFFMVLGIFGIVLINLFGNIIVSNEQNYYLLKEVTEAAMYDAIDMNVYKNGLTIASGTDTTPFLPDNNSEITNNNLSTGLTIKDSNQNEWRSKSTEGCASKRCSAI